jgi:KamA family protein
LTGERLAAAVSYLGSDTSIREVILSGGDPLSVADGLLSEIVERLAGLDHVVRLRVHSRWPIVAPERVGADLLAALTGTRLRPVLVVHSNHPNEIDASVCRALERLRARSVPVLNQAVLLRGINDDAEVLERLSECLFAAGVLPYYLHLLDPVAGAAHFEVGEAEARALVRELETRLPGYLVPRLVREVPGSSSKIRVAP